MIFCRL